MCEHAGSESEVCVDDPCRDCGDTDCCCDPEGCEGEVQEPVVEPEPCDVEEPRVVRQTDGLSCVYCGAKVAEGPVDKRAYIEVYSKEPQGDPAMKRRVGGHYWLLRCRRCGK